jgi:pimeloyl-ACP methyl ester carboxylesterase
MMKTLTIALAVLSLVALVADSTSTATDSRAAYCAGRGDVGFRARDDVRLVGHAFGRGKTVVVLAHESRGSLCQWVPYARRLTTLGYQAFAFDFRNHGRSQQVGYGRSYRFAADVTAAVKYVRSRGATKVYLVGGSMGAAAVLASGAFATPAVAGIVSLSAPSSFGGVEPMTAVPRLRAPVLYVASADDAQGGFARDARALYNATAAEDKTVEIIAGTSHGVGLVSSAGRARELVEEFLQSH